MKRERIDFIDFAKGFAILSIVIFHYSQPYAHGIWNKAIMLGGTGVHLFFIISGFGLGISSQHMELYGFFKRRFIKILFPYYLVILLIFVVNKIYPIYPDDGIYALGGHIFLYKMFDERIIGSFGYHFWFLSTIIQFYISFPLIIRIKNKTTLLFFFLFSLLISICYWISISYLNVADMRTYNSFFLQYLWEFSMGIALADIYMSKNKKFWDQSILTMLFFSALGIGIMGIMSIKLGRLGQTFNDIPASLGFLSLSIATFLIGKHIIIFRKFIQYAGTVSYELFLIHMIIFIVLTRAIQSITGTSANLLVSFIFILPVTIALAAMLNSFNSKYISKLSHYINKKQGTSTISNVK